MKTNHLHPWDQVRKRPGAAVAFASLSMAMLSSVQASDYADRVLTNGAVAYYRMNEASGTTAIDAVAAQNGTYFGGLTLGNPGPRPPAFLGFEAANTDATFNESTTYMDTGTAISSLNATSYSMEIWYSDSFDGGLHYIGGRYAGAGSYQGDSLIVFGALYFFDGNTLYGGTPSGPGWHDTVLTRNGSTVDVYLDGALSFSIASSTAEYGTSNEFVVGARGDLISSTFFKGGLDELSIYDGALTAAQVAGDYAVAVIPEPSAVMLLGLGGLLFWRRRAG